jgi:hypothetical protein
MRRDLLPLSASALVVGVMCLVLGSLLNPTGGGDSGGAIVRAVTENSGRWAAMAVMYFGSSVAMVLGLPAVLSLFDRRGRRMGTLAVTVLSVGILGTAGYAMLMVFFHALVAERALGGRELERVVSDPTLSAFVLGWIGAFYAGIALLAWALFLARRTPTWMPVLLLVFVAMLPVVEMLGRVGSAVQLMLLAVAFTGIAITAVNLSQQAPAQPVR